MTDATTTVLARITGRVQGVAYRAWAEREATARGLAGWVRNRSDGSVEALFHGPPAAVDDMLAACRRGPMAARVDAVETAPADEAPPQGFAQRKTL